MNYKFRFPAQDIQKWTGRSLNSDYYRKNLATVKACNKSWNSVPDIEPIIWVNPRLKTSLAKCDPQEQLIGLNPLFVDSKNYDLLKEVLVHEMAHLAVFKVVGNTAKPHGREWQNFMTEAGYQPRVQIPYSSQGELAHPPPRSLLLYRHQCPVCHYSKTARRPHTDWRCPTCLDNCLDGTLVIESITSQNKD